MVTSREIRLKSRPVGMPSAENFELATVTVPEPAPGEVQVKNIWMTVDPYMRGRMVDRASYCGVQTAVSRSLAAVVGSLEMGRSRSYRNVRGRSHLCRLFPRKRGDGGYSL